MRRMLTCEQLCDDRQAQRSCAEFFAPIGSFGGSGEAWRSAVMARAEICQMSSRALRDVRMNAPLAAQECAIGE